MPIKRMGKGFVRVDSRFSLQIRSSLINQAAASERLRHA